MTLTRQRWILILALAGTLLAVYNAPAAHGDAVVPLERPRLPLPQTMTTPVPDQGVMAIAPRAGLDDTQEAQPWTVLGHEPIAAPPSGGAPLASPPSVASVVVPAAAESPTVVLPAPPPLPFKVVGQARDEAGPIVFLQHGDDNLVVRPGDRIGDAYRLDQIDAASLTLTYLPWNSVQTLNMAASP